MVKLYALTILYKGPTSATALKSAYEIDSFSYFQRGSVKEFMAFVSKTITERTQIAARQSVKEGGKIDNYFLHNFLVIFDVTLLLHKYVHYSNYLPYLTNNYLKTKFFFRIHVPCLCKRR